MVSPHQQHVAARKNDLLGTLADTCRARRLLNFQTRHDFIATMKAGDDDWNCDDYCNGDGDDWCSKSGMVMMIVIRSGMLMITVRL